MITTSKIIAIIPTIGNHNGHVTHSHGHAMIPFSLKTKKAKNIAIITPTKIFIVSLFPDLLGILHRLGYTVYAGPEKPQTERT